MATRYITLADGTQIPVTQEGEDVGNFYDYDKALNEAGYLSPTGQGTIDYFNQTYGTQFGSPLDYYTWLYGGGGLEDVNIRGTTSQYFKTPNGTESLVNQPLSYEPADTFQDQLGLYLVGGIAGAGLTGMLPGTTNVFSGLGGTGAGMVDVGGQAMDLSGYFAGTDSFAGLGAGGFGDLGNLTSLMSDGGVGGENILEGMDLSSGMTNFDSGPGYLGNTTGPLSGSNVSPLLKILQGGGGISDYLKLAGGILPSALGAYGASQQADAYGDMFNKYFGMGEPYRNLLQQSYQPGFDVAKEPGFQNAMDTALNTYMRAASAGNASGVASGNPYDNPGAAMESQKYLLGNLALPYLQNYRSGLSSAGQLGMGPSAQFGAGQIGAQGGIYDSIGYGLGEILNPKPDYTKQFMNLVGGGGLV